MRGNQPVRNRHRGRTGVTSAFLALAVAATSQAAPNLAMVGPGSVAPDFALLDVLGNTFRLSDYRGQVVLLALIGHG